MAPKCSIAPAVVWNWVIEALASSEQADVSTLLGLVETAPAISGDAGEDTREIISLRILENLFDNDSEAVTDVNIPKVSFDASERCEDVLKKILQETSEPMTKLEKEKWDVGTFLKHKRSSLPKCSLTKLKEAMLDDNNPLFALLKEKSKLVISNASEDTSPVNDDESPLNPNKDKNIIQENVLQDDNAPQETYTEGHNKRVSVDSMGNLEFAVKTKDSNILQPNNEKANDDERTGIASKKEAFLKSQCTTGQDSLALIEWSEIDLCMKCNESGELLLCSSDSCLLRFHVSCLGSTVTFEENGKFFCPFCAYSRAISKYQEAKRNASLARKKLQAFSNFTVKPRPNELSTKPSELEENEDIQMGENINCMSNDKESQQSTGANCLSNDKESQRSTRANCMPNDKESQRSADANCMSNDKQSQRSADTNCVSNDKESQRSISANCMSNDKESQRSAGANCMSNDKESQRSAIANCMSNDKESQRSAVANCMSNDKESQRSTDANCMSNDKECQRSTGVNDDEETTELPENPIPQPTTPKQKCKEKESLRSAESSLTIRLRKRKAKHASPPPVPLLRRRKLPWTKSEVETLKEGVERYSSGKNTKIPWKEILDFGHKVFNKGRTTIDLKDKWRNICK
ncbi:uncharacterized protein LOC143582635 [Bidens hawaiensis]|uniref:uncharacterized protein LOC143582635 n=1 Tax=Bidens hawaiensis TaxID=980011 RepID=UPI00404B1970